MISSPLLPDVLRYCIDTLAQDIVRPLPGVTSGNPNYHALLNFRLVSKACNAHASSHVYKTIRITEDTRRTVRFIANLKGNPNLTKHIKSIEIYLVQRRGSVKIGSARSYIPHLLRNLQDESCSGNAIKSLRVSALHPDEKSNRFSWKDLADEFIFELFRTTQNIYVSRSTRSTASFEGYKELHIENFFISELMDIPQALITNCKPSIKSLTLRNVVFNHPSEEEKRFVATSPLFPDISLKSVPSPDFFCRKLSYAPSDISAIRMSQFSDNFARPFSDLQELDFCVLDSRDRDFFDKIKKNFAKKVHNRTINTTYFVTDPSGANGTKKGPRDHLFVLKDFPSLRSLRVTAHECPFGFLDDPTQTIISYNKSYCDIYFLPSLFEVNKPVPSLETIELTTQFEITDLRLVNGSYAILADEYRWQDLHANLFSVKLFPALRRVSLTIELHGFHEHATGQEIRNANSFVGTRLATQLLQRSVRGERPELNFSIRVRGAFRSGTGGETFE